MAWKLNGTEISLLPVGRLTLDLVNQQPDALRFEKSEIEFDTGAAYTSAPTLTISGGGGTGATGTASVAAGVVSAVSLTAAGSGYTSAPDVALSGGGSFGAQVEARLTPTTVDSASVIDLGSGYTSAPDVIVEGGGGSGAAFTAVLATRAISALTLVSGGINFTSAPTVVFSGGGGSGAAATAVLNSVGRIISITVTAAGSGYTSAPTVSFSGGGGTGAAAVAVLGTASVASAALTAAGSGFLTRPAVSLAGGGGSGAAITAVLAGTTLLGINVTNAGSGYSSPPTVTISGGGGSGATAIAVLTAGAVSAITVTAGGSGYTQSTTVTITGGGGSGATARCVLTGTGVGKIFPDQDALLNWSGTPTIAFTGGGGSGAAATAVVDGIVYAVALTNAGTGYTSRPTVTLSGGGGSGASAFAEFHPTTGVLVKIVLLRHGTGYTSDPIVTITGGGGSGATAVAYFTRAITSCTITSAGSGYTSAPTVSFSSGTRTAGGTTSLVGTSIASIVMTAGGVGYTSAPTVAITASADGSAELYAQITSGIVTAIAIRDIDDLGYPKYLGGVGYTSAPTITVYASTGSGATATATVTSGAISSISVGAGGSGYTYPWQVSTGVGRPNAGSGATATATLGVVVESIALTDPGSGYTTVPTVSFSGGGGSGAAATAILTPTSLASLTVTAGGTGYTSAPTITIAAGLGSGATAATAAATLGGAAIASFEMTNYGGGYTSAPTVSLSGGGGSGASGTAVRTVISSTSIDSLILTNAGSGYTSAPTISFSGGGGTGASATATLTSAALVSLTKTASGSGYTSVPTIRFSGGGGSGATATVLIVPTTVADLVLTHNGGVPAFDSAIVLTQRNNTTGVEETWFRGVIRESPRTRSSRENRISYVALGPWQWLERIPFLQTFKKASDATNPASVLTTYQRGRVVIAQDDDGTKVTLGEFLNLVLDYAINAKPGVMQRADFSGLSLTIPWDEAIDLSCAEVISRVLQFLPDAVAWWDYSLNPPQLNIARRADLEAIALPVQPAGSADDATAYAPLESVDLRERADLRKTGVSMLYLSTNRTNETSWEKATPDVYPVGTIANDPDTLFRTIQLAGSVSQGTQLSQRIDVDPIPSLLQYDTDVWLTDTGDATFLALRTWWKSRAHELVDNLNSTITIKGFANCTREGDSVGTDAELNNELVSGSITDWMEENHNIASEDQKITAYIHYEEVRANDSSKKAQHVKKFVAVIKATNAVTRTYRFSEETAYTPPEEVPVGLARAIYDAISVPQYDGSVSLVENEPTRRVLIGHVLNLTGSLADWATMNALVQRARIDIERGVTEIQVGPPRQLGPDDLTELYRVNRNRAPVTSYSTRTTGVTGGASGGSQGLGRHHRGGARASGIAQAPANYTAAISKAGTVPTPSEVRDAIAGAYASNNIPLEGDVITLTDGGVVKFIVVVTYTEQTTDGWRILDFDFSSVTFYALVNQVGLY